MRLVINIFLLFVSNYCLAQNWAENNAVWHYEQINIQPPFDEDYNKFSTIGDTIILGEPAKIILEERVTLNGTFTNEIFMKSDSNRVYLFDSISNSFKLIYDFNALPGDTIEVFCPERVGDSTITIVVDSVSTININGTVLGLQHVSQTAMAYYYMSGIIIENIGWTGFMFPLSTLADPPYGGALRCFQNDSIGLYKLSTVDCDYLTGIKPIHNSKNLSVYPNPANDVISVSVAKELDLKNVVLTLVDISGRTVLTQTIKSTETTVDINYLQKGVYLLKIGEQTTKLIKQ
jgi:hypothetical protein